MRSHLLLVAVLGTIFSIGLVPAANALVAGGPLSVVDASGHALERGTSQTQFTLAVPKGAACQRDSKDGGYRVQSFLVPQRYEPGTLTYNSVQPNGDGNWSLFDVFTNPYAQAQTGVATKPGGVGPVVNTPMFSFAVFLPRLDLLPSGTYHMGLACTLYNHTTRYWTTNVAVRVRPAGAEKLTWRVLTPARAASGGSSVLPTAALIVAVGLIGALAMVVRRSRVRLHPAEAQS